MRLANILFKTNTKFPPHITKLTDRAKAIKVPHKSPSKDDCELHWKFGCYVCQLKRITFNYCPTKGDSRGVRHFLDYEAYKYVKANPQVSVYCDERPGQTPRLVAVYMNGNSRIISIPNHDNQAIYEWLNRLTNESGRLWSQERVKKPWISTNPSIQGVWTPFTFKPPIDINPNNFMENNKEATEASTN